MMSFLGINLPKTSTIAGSVDSLYDFIMITSVISFVIIVAGMLYFMLRYRRKSEQDKTAYIEGHTPTEIGVIVVLFVWVMVIFVWGYVDYRKMIHAPSGALEINVIGRQWQWEIEYPNGKKALNEIRVPKGQPVKLILTSSDVLHSFYIPNFRLKQDAVPGMYTTLWFEATETGRQQVFCAEYCGTAHSKMFAVLIVMEPEEYQNWLEGWSPETQAASNPATRGKELYQSRGCVACHSLDGSAVVGPSFLGVFGTEKILADGSKVSADENYIRESLMEPQAKLVKGFAPVMPTYKGQLSDEEVNVLLAFIKGLKKE